MGFLTGAMMARNFLGREVNSTVNALARRIHGHTYIVALQNDSPGSSRSGLRNSAGFLQSHNQQTSIVVPRKRAVLYYWRILYVRFNTASYTLSACDGGRYLHAYGSS